MAGYLEKRGKHSWRLIVSHGFDSYGNRIKYTKSIKANSRREADKELVNFVYEIENGIVLQNSSMTFKEFKEHIADSGYTAPDNYMITIDRGKVYLIQLFD